MGCRSKKGRRSQRELTPTEIEERCQQIIEAEPADWDKLYLRLRTSPIGPDYPAEVFVRTPISQLQRVIKEVQYLEYERANFYSQSTANLASLLVSVASGLAGSKSSGKLPEPKSFLPFPELDKFFTEDGSQGPSTETKAVAGRLLKERRIPIHVFTAVHTFTPENA